MRKILTIGGAGAVLALIGGFLFMQWAERQVLAEVDRQFVSLRAAGIAAEHGAVRAGVWSRSVEIEDVELGTAGAPGITATIALVKAEGVAPVAASIRTAKLRLLGVSVGGSAAGPGETRFSLKIPLIEAERLVTPMIWPAMGTVSDRGAAIGAVLQSIAADVLSIPKLEFQATLPSPPQAAHTAWVPASPSLVPASIDISYVYSGVKLTGIADGRISAMNIAEARFSGTTGSGSIIGATNRDVDMMPFFGVGLANRQSSDGYYRVQGKSAIGRITIKVPNGAGFAMGSITSDGVSVDPTRFTYQKLIDLVAVAGGGQQLQSPQQMNEFMERLAQVYEGLRVDAVEMRELSGMPGGASREFTLASASMTGLVKGRLASIRIDGLDTTLPPQHGRALSAPQKFRIGSLEIKGLDFAGIFRKASAFQPRHGMPPPSPEEFLTLIEGVEMTATTLPDPTTGLLNKIHRFAVAWGRPVNGVPADVKVALKGEFAVNPADPNLAALRGLGLATLAVDIDLGSSFEPLRRQLTFAPIRITAGKMGALEARIVLGDVGLAAYSFAPTRFANALPGFAIRSLEVDFIDDGLLASVMPSAAAGQPSVGKSDVAGALKGALIDPSQPPGNLSAILDSVGLLVREGNKRMTLKLTANEIVRIGDFAVAGPGSPPGSMAPLIEKFALDVRVGR